MHRVPLWLAILAEVILICGNDYFRKPEIWYVIGINAIFIIYSIGRAIYEYYEYSSLEGRFEKKEDENKRNKEVK